jgi:hypothetical protein
LALTLLPSLAICIQALTVLLHTVLEEHTTASTEHIANHVTTLRVATDHELGFGTALAVLGDLLDAIGLALRHRAAVRRRERVVELDVLVVAVAIIEAGADGLDELALAAGVGFIVAAGEEDVDGGAWRVLTRLTRQESVV